MQKHIIYFLLCILLTFTGLSHAEEENYTIATFPIPLMVEDENTGVFIDLTKEIAKRSQINITIKVLPPKRTAKLFHDNNFHGFFPALDVMVTKEIAKSDPIYIKKDFAFTKNDRPPVNGITDLAGKKVGITLGYPYAKQITNNSTFTIMTAQNDIANMKKLDAGRIDIFVVEEKSGLTAIQQSGKNNISYQSSQPLSSQDVYYAFQADKTGKHLASLFSKALAEIKKDGTFNRIMSQTDKQ